jgi:hypothetical protein
MESSCERGNEPSGSIKCWELPSGCTTCVLSCGTQLHIVSYIYRLCGVVVRVLACRPSFSVSWHGDAVSPARYGISDF